MRVTLPRVIHAEWTKLRALRSTWTVLGATSLLVVVFAGIVAWNQNRDAGNPPSTADAVSGALLGIDLVSLVIGVFGVLLMSGEYGSGLIRATLAAVPRRLPVLWAKALVLSAVTAPVLLLTCLASLAVSRAFLGAGGPSLGDPAVLRAAFGAAGAAAGTGLLGLAVGTLLRHTAGAITTLVAAMLVIPALLPVALPDSVEKHIVPYVPTAAGQAMYSLGDTNPFEMLSPGGGALVLGVWVVALLAGGAAVLHRRDA
jgi:ABC-2 type transport system permease protein